MTFYDCTHCIEVVLIFDAISKTNRNATNYLTVLGIQHAIFKGLNVNNISASFHE